MLGWFNEEEREECSACGRRACVRLPEGAPSRFCLACGAVWLDGERLDANVKIRTDSS